MALIAGLFWKSWRQASNSARASPEWPGFFSTLARLYRVLPMSSSERSSARWTSSVAVDGVGGILFHVAVITFELPKGELCAVRLEQPELGRARWIVGGDDEIELNGHGPRFS